MKLEERVRLNELFDAYGCLLSSTQKEITSEFLNYDLTFSEIADNRNVSRQASFITFKHCVKKLEDLEAKLGIIENKAKARDLKKEVLRLLKSGKVDDAIKKIESEEG